eukprot:851813_1
MSVSPSVSVSQNGQHGDIFTQLAQHQTESPIDLEEDTLTLNKEGDMQNQDDDTTESLTPENEEEHHSKIKKNARVAFTVPNKSIFDLSPSPSPSPIPNAKNKNSKPGKPKVAMQNGQKVALPESCPTNDYYHTTNSSQNSSNKFTVNRKNYEMTYSNVPLQLARNGLTASNGNGLSSATGSAAILIKNTKRWIPRCVLMFKDRHEESKSGSDNEIDYHFHCKVSYQKRVHTSNPDVFNLMGVRPFILHHATALESQWGLPRVLKYLNYCCAGMSCVEVVQTLSDPTRFVFYGAYCGISCLNDLIGIFLQSPTHGPGMHVIRMTSIKDTQSKPDILHSASTSTTSSLTSNMTTSSSASKRSYTSRASTLKCKARIAQMIQEGAAWEEIERCDPIYVANHFVQILSLYVSKKNTMMPPISQCAAIDKQSNEYMQLNGPSRAMVDLYELILVKKIRQKGIGIVYVFGETDSYKTSVVRRAIAPIVTVRDIQYHAGWNENALPSSSEIEFCDGLTRDTIKNGLGIAMMKHAGDQTEFIQPRRFLSVQCIFNPPQNVTKNRKSAVILWLNSNLAPTELFSVREWRDVLQSRCAVIQCSKQYNLRGAMDYIRQINGLP